MLTHGVWTKRGPPVVPDPRLKFGWGIGCCVLLRNIRDTRHVALAQSSRAGNATTVVTSTTGQSPGPMLLRLCTITGSRLFLSYHSGHRQTQPTICPGPCIQPAGGSRLIQMWIIQIPSDCKSYGNHIDLSGEICPLN